MTVNRSPRERPRMSSTARRSRSARRGGVQRSLTEEQIVSTALETSREVGLEGLTMTLLAKKLGVGVMTLYSYFRGRDELLDAMAHRAATELYDQHEDLEGAAWDAELRAHYHSIRESLKRHPSLADLLFFRGQVMPSGSTDFDSMAEHARRHVTSMVAAGVRADLAVRAFIGLSLFTVASALRRDDYTDAASPYRGLVEQLTHSLSSSLPTEFVGDARFGSDEQFDTMLDLTINGIRAAIEASPRSKRPSTPRGRAQPDRQHT
ncbi:TetR/AcrR family transcriptional regulator [Mycobacterium sp. MMS18-G62]